MSRYKCIKAFSVPRFDEYEEIIDGKSFYVRKGSEWETDEWFNVNAEVTLVKVNGPEYLGISKDTLEKFFVEVEDE